MQVDRLSALRGSTQCSLLSVWRSMMPLLVACWVAGCALALWALPVYAEAPPIYLGQWGSYGSGNGQFNTPDGLVIDSQGDLYVLDTNNSRLQQFDSATAYVNQWGGAGQGDGQLSLPQGLALDSSDNFYIADTGNYRVQKWDSSGSYVSQFGTYGSGDGQFEWPVAVAVDSAGNIYVLDNSRNRVQKFDSNGNYLLQWGTLGSADGEFNGPYDLAIDSSDQLYVADGYNNRIQKFDSAGNHLLSWGTSGSGDGQFDWPTAVAVDSNGNVYVADTNNSRAQKFDSNGGYLTQWGWRGSNNGQFESPYGIQVGNNGKVYVVDSGNHRVQIFGKGTPTPSSALAFSSSSNGKVDSISFQDEDILRYDPGTDQWTLLFDGSDVGVGNADLDAFALVPDGSILMSFDKAIKFPLLGTADDSDIVRFLPRQLGINTIGSFQLMFDGSAVGLTTDSEDIDAIVLDWDANALLISTEGTAKVTGADGQDEDLLAFTPIAYTPTPGTWSLFFDGSAVKLTSGDEDVTAAAVDKDGQLYLATKGKFSAFSLSAIQGDNNDIFGCTLSGTGLNTTACTFFAFFDGDFTRFRRPIDGIGFSFDAATMLAAADSTTVDVEPVQFEVVPEQPVSDDPEWDSFDRESVEETDAAIRLYLPVIAR